MTKTTRLSGLGVPAVARVLTVLLTLIPLLGQVQEGPDDLTAESVRAAKALASNNLELDPELRERILSVYDEAINSLTARRAFANQVLEFQSQERGIGQKVNELREKLSQPEEIARVDFPEDVKYSEVENALARQRALLAAYQAALREIEEEAENRDGLRNETARRLGTLDQIIEQTSDDLRTTTDSTVHPELKKAARMALLARRAAALDEIAALRAQLTLFDASGVLLPWQRDEAERKVVYTERLVALLVEEAEAAGRAEADRYLQEVRELADKVSTEIPDLADLASETEAFATALYSPDGILSKAEETARDLVETRRHMADMDRLIQLMRRQFRAVGHSGPTTQWWPKVPADFPRLIDLRAAVSKRERAIPQLETQLIDLEQERANVAHVQAEVAEKLAGLGVGLEVGELEELAHDLLNERRDLLDEMIKQNGRYLNELMELDTLSRYFLSEAEKATAFLYERFLWARSVPDPLIPAVSDMWDSFLWISSLSNWSEVGGSLFRGIRSAPVGAATVLLLLALLLAFRRWAAMQFNRIAELVRDPARDSFPLTLEALAYTLIRIAPAPLVLYSVSTLLDTADGSAFLHACSRAVFFAGTLTLLFESGRQTLFPNGLGEVHFGWPSEITRSIRRSILVPELIFLPLMYLALHFAAAGLMLESPAELQNYSNALGRTLFVAAMLGFGLSMTGILRPRGVIKASDKRTAADQWSRRLSLYAVPLVILFSIVPALLAVLGFYITGFGLSYIMGRTIALCLFLAIAFGLLLRWRLVTFRRTSGSGAEDSGVAFEITAAERQVRDILRFAVLLVLGIGIVAIWSEGLPALQMLKRIQILPELKVVDSLGGEPSLVSAPVPGASAGGGGAETAVSADAAPLPASLGPKTAPAEEIPESETLTLWDILQSIIAGVITFVLAKNIPGVVELVLKRRTLIDPGARIAVSTLVRYTITIIGVSLTFSLLGLTWSRIQFLAAALTFGLGFGLQEIVANFVSGLILLLERPVRVGDAVTIGNLQGRVTRIQIRATTITLWDRSEMIVPNKEFITSKLVNWTLSDSRRRIDIPVRVAYGSDVAHVKKTLLDVAEAHENVLSDPAPQALLLEFGEHAMKFELRFFVEFGLGLQTKDDLQVSVDRAFRENGISFALQHLDIRVTGPESKVDGAEAALPRPAPAATD